MVGVGDKLIHANGCNLTPHILIVTLSVIALSSMAMHMNEDIAKQLRAIQHPMYPFPIVVSLRTPPGEIHFRDSRSGALIGKLIGIGTSYSKSSG